MAADNDTLSIKIAFDGDKVTREFISSYKNTQFGQALNKISKKSNFATSLATALGKIHSMEPSLVEKILQKNVFSSDDIFKAQPVPWYLSEFFTKLKKSQGNSSNCSITVKACREHYFYTLAEITNNEESRLLHAPFFHRMPPPTNPKEQMDKVRGLADTILFLAPHLPNNNIDNLIDFISWFKIKLQCEILQNGASGNSFLLKINPDIDNNKYIELPGKKKILVASPNIRNAIANLCEVWLNPTAKSVLLSASPGSGKERLVHLLKDAMSVNKEINHIDISASAIGKFQNLRDIIIQKCFEETLVEVSLNDNVKSDSLKELPDEVRNKLRYNKTKKALGFKGPMSKTERDKLLKLKLSSDVSYQEAVNKLFQQSLILQQRTILFLDEIHHDAAHDIRSGLLRFMETGGFEKESGEKFDCKLILYVLAASLPPEDLRTLVKPQDLWTRIEYTVKYLHPLRIEDAKERKMILKEYFHLFWKNQEDEWKAQETLDIYKKIRNFTAENVYNDLAKLFVDELGSPLIPLISIRTIGFIVRRLFSRTMNYFRVNPKLLDTNKINSNKEQISNEFEKWIVEIANELIPEIETKGLF